MVEKAAGTAAKGKTAATKPKPKPKPTPVEVAEEAKNAEKVVSKYSTKAAAAYIAEKLDRPVTQVLLRRFLRTDDGGSNDGTYTRYGWNTEEELDQLAARFEKSSLGTGQRGTRKKEAGEEAEAPQELSELDEEADDEVEDLALDESDDEEESDEEEEEAEEEESDEEEDDSDEDDDDFEEA
jgi:hypothetical protein